MKRTQLVRLRLSESQKAQADELRREAGRAWSEMLVFHWRVYRKKGIWLSKNSLQRWAKGRYALHSQTVQALVDKLHANFDTARKLRKAGDPNAKFPYKRKRFQVVTWKGQAIRIKDGHIYLPNGRGQAPFSVRLPERLQSVTLDQAELVWRDGDYWLAVITVASEVEAVSGNRSAAIDMGEIHAMALTDGDEALLISGRAMRSAKRWRNKRVSDISRLQSRCKKGSARYRKLQRAKNRIKAKAQRQQRDLSHKVSRMAVNWLVDHQIGTVVIGDLRDIADGKRLNRVSQQKIGQWQRGQQEQYVEYKFAAHGGQVKYRSERGTSSTCPACGERVTPNGRIFKCACGFVAPRDVVGASGILSLEENGQVHGARIPRSVKYRMPADFRRGLRSAEDTGQSGLGHPPQESHAF